MDVVFKHIPSKEPHVSHLISTFRRLFTELNNAERSLLGLRPGN